mgnify:CR=1 FL=1
MLRIKNKNIYINRGDSANIQLACNNANFEPGNYIKFYIMKENDCEDVLLTKQFNITELTNTVDIQLTSEDTRSLGESFKNGYQTYWYEVELNRDALEPGDEDMRNTLIGYDDNGPKLFILYPEATEGSED